jgi:arylsulfatase A-like enzyme
MLAVEDMIDSVAAAVAEAGQTDRTLIFFTSDNGFHFNEHRLGAFKVTAYDEDIRVPLLVAGPGILRGAVAHDIVLNQDLPVTLAELAGAVPGNLVDGRSFVPLLSGAGGDFGRNGLLVQRWRRDPDRPPPYAYNLLGYRAVRTNDYLYVEWDTGEFELYKRRSDPWEMENLYQRADPEFLAQLTAWADRLSGCAGPTCRAAEDETPPPLRLIPE